MHKWTFRIVMAICMAVLVVSGIPQRQPVTASNPAMLIADTSVGKPGLAFSFVGTLGVAEEPYAVNTQLVNQPMGVYLDSAGMLFVAEGDGRRVVRADSSFSPIGVTGTNYVSNYSFDYPNDMAKDKHGNLWVVDSSRVVSYDVSGQDPVFLQSIPAENSWEWGNDDYHFSDANSIAFDNLADQHMFVADGNNNRVQVYRFDGEGKPVYVNTIGTGPLPGSDNLHFNWPYHLAMDTSNRLLVADTNNNRVQRCASSDNWQTWTCSPIPLGPVGELSSPNSVAVAPNGDYIIADNGNWRILRCNPMTGCTVAWQDLEVWIQDVEAKDNGDVIVAGGDTHAVWLFSPGSPQPSVLMGEADHPYDPIPGHLYTPWGITAAPDGSIYVTENQGYRLVKFNAAGQQQWVVGTPGVYTTSDDGFSNYWAGLEGSPAVDASGRIYVTDTSNDRVQIFNANGAFVGRLGETRVGGQDNAHFACPTGATINPVNGDLLVVDHCNHRVQVFAAGTLAYKATLGETEIFGSDNAHFNWPYAVAVDSTGAVYVADSENFRVQKCTYTTGSSFSCTTFAGETGLGGWEYDRIHPLSLAVDSANRVYVVDDWNSRVIIYDRFGDMLSVIAGGWGNYPTDFRNTSAVAVDKQGRVYVTDSVNGRVNIFAPGGHGGWMQINVTDFGTASNNSAWSLGWHNNTLYAGMMNNDNGAEIWRKGPGNQWEPVVTGGLGNSYNKSVDHFLSFNGYLYAGIYNDLGDGASQGGEIWRSATGNEGSWEAVVTGGSGTDTPDPRNGEFYRLFTFNNKICATTWSGYTPPAGSDPHGAEIWCSAIGSAGTWTRLSANGLVNDPDNIGILTVTPFNGKLYAGTYNEVSGTNVYYSADGVAWAPLFNEGGWGDAGNFATTAIEVFDGHLYFTFMHTSGYGITLGRCQVCDGSDTEEMAEPANSFGDPTVRAMPGLEVHDGSLYIVIGSYYKGIHLYKSADGTNWQLAAPPGFGNPSVNMSYWDNGILSANGNLYLATYSSRADLAQVWQLGKQIFLPLTVR